MEKVVSIRGIDYSVEYVGIHGNARRLPSRWTHSLTIKRPKGKKCFVVNARIVNDRIVKVSTPTFLRQIP